jgi:transglycosylase-like protein with SLT domain
VNPRTSLSLAAVAVSSIACVSLHAATPVLGVDEPRFWYDPAIRLGHPTAESMRNRDGSPRITDPEHYARFFREHAATLQQWAADARLRLNPNFVAALLAKESGFDPYATSAVPANGLAQITHIADADLVIISRDAPAFHWMKDEVSRWPRYPPVHDDKATKARTDSLIARGVVTGRNEYLFNPRSAMRASMFWLRMLADIWRLDEWPGQYGRLARERLGAAGTLGERDLLDLVTVSYNQGHPYVAELLRKYGRDWKRHLNDESRDYLERIVLYTEIFQRASR